MSDWQPQTQLPPAAGFACGEGEVREAGTGPALSGALKASQGPLQGLLAFCILEGHLSAAFWPV